VIASHEGPLHLTDAGRAALAAIVVQCGRCRRGYSADEFDALPLPTSGRDRVESEGALLVTRLCPCTSTLSRTFCAKCGADLDESLACPNGCGAAR
jgi:hypothetical protein